MEIRTSLFNTPVRRWLQRLSLLLFPVGIYALLLLVSQSAALRYLGLSLRYNVKLPLLLYLILIYGAYRLPGWWGRLVSLSLVMALFSLGLVGLWSIGEGDYLAISGLLPWSDGRGFYIDALRLLQGWGISDFSNWRPLFTPYLALLLLIGGQNLQLTVAVLTALVAVVCYAAIEEVRRSHGALAAVFLLAILYFFYRRYIGYTTAEQVGFPLGVLGFALLWRAASLRQRKSALAGVLLVTMGLFVRFGAFFVIPALLIWGGVYFRGSRRFDWRFVGWGTAAFVVCLLFYAGVVYGLSEKPESPLPYYSKILYQFSKGYGKRGDIALYRDHPELENLDEEERTRRTLNLAWQNVRQEPSALLDGARHTYEVLASMPSYHAYSFIETKSDRIASLIPYGMGALCLLGLVGALVKRGEGVFSLTLAGVLGVLISVPFAPPDLYNRMRFYAASMPVFGMLPLCGVLWVLEPLRRRQWLKLAPIEELPAGVTALIGAVLLATLVASPLAVALLRQPARFEAGTCAPDQDVIYLRHNLGASIQIVADEATPMSWMPVFKVNEFRRNAHNNSPYYGTMKTLEQIEAPATFTVGLDLLAGGWACMVASEDELPRASQPGDTWGVCGHWYPENAAGRNARVSDQFFFADRIFIANPGNPR